MFVILTVISYARFIGLSKAFGLGANADSVGTPRALAVGQKRPSTTYFSSMQKPSKLIFLPGALGRTEFWRPASDLLTYPALKVHMTWPGFCGIPPDPSIRGIDDLVSRVLDDIDQPSALIAQSMGGVVALLAALKKPELITHLVLSVTSGGLGSTTLDAEDWRPAAQAVDSRLPDWFTNYHEDLKPSLYAVHADAAVVG
ncbi:alpha/beta fold hydrolase [Massilia glaciei]|uniref:alpha/beta fold hydrolase n=1 Tax=Massilia glaciei TaxID=1524097 RepID=UPI0027D7D94B|nr:alpha/beta fold hydrolase [Massilia glaciei]